MNRNENGSWGRSGAACAKPGTAGRPAAARAAVADRDRNLRRLQGSIIKTLLRLIRPIRMGPGTTGKMILSCQRR